MKYIDKNKCVYIIMGLCIIFSGAKCQELFPWISHGTEDTGCADTDTTIDTEGEVYVVDQNGNGDFLAIQDCIDAAATGDVCSVNAGLYFENINYLGKGITLLSVAGPDATIIDGNASGAAVLVENSGGNDAVLSGFTVKNGSDSGVMCTNSSLSIINCIISNNQGQNGGAVNARESSLSVQDTVISNNISESRGGGIYIHTQTSSGRLLTAINTSITGNVSKNGQGGGGIYIYNDNTGDVNLVNCIVSGNQSGDNEELSSIHGGGAIYFYSGHDIGALTMTNCTLSDNNALNAVYGGGAIYLYRGMLTLVNSILSFNETTAYIPFPDEQPTGGAGGAIYQYGGSQEVSHAVVYGNMAEEDDSFHSSQLVPFHEYLIDADPMFVNAALHDYHIQSSSPCIDSGDNYTPDLAELDIDGDDRIIDGDGLPGDTVDIGADEFIPFL